MLLFKVGIQLHLNILENILGWQNEKYWSLVVDKYDSEQSKKYNWQTSGNDWSGTFRGESSLKITKFLSHAPPFHIALPPFSDDHHRNTEVIQLVDLNLLLLTRHWSSPCWSSSCSSPPSWPASLSSSPSGRYFFLFYSSLLFLFYQNRSHYQGCLSRYTSTCDQQRCPKKFTYMSNMVDWILQEPGIGAQLMELLNGLVFVNFSTIQHH